MKVTLEETPMLRVNEAARLARVSERWIYQHLPFFKTYILKRPGAKKGVRLISRADFLAYIERSAQGATNLNE